MSQAGIANFNNSGMGFIQTINGDTGSITGHTVTIYANQAAQNSGASVLFVNSGTVSTLNLSDSNDNTFLGRNAGGVNGSVNSADNVGVGVDALLKVTNNGVSNVAVGAGALGSLTSGEYNVAFGFNAGGTFTTGGENILIGPDAGSDYTSSESNNIIVGGYLGVAGDNNKMYLGNGLVGGATITKTFIEGITGVTNSNAQQVTINSSTGQLGVSNTALGTWSDTSGTVNAASGNGYFITAACTSTLPASPAEGDTISYIVDTASTLTITGNTGQKIRLGASLSAAAGTCANNARGDSITLVYRTTGTTWFATSSVGTWTIT